jgi:hypothetical protein
MDNIQNFNCCMVTRGLGNILADLSETEFCQGIQYQLYVFFFCGSCVAIILLRLRRISLQLVSFSFPLDAFSLLLKITKYSRFFSFFFGLNYIPVLCESNLILTMACNTQNCWV